jgi:AcrR family transcriptional regulator
MPDDRSAPRRKDAVATRERLVRSALELFASQGFKATTTVEIAAGASIAEATIYRHFDGKDALFNDAFRLALRWAIGLVPSSDGVRGPPIREQLTRIARRLIDQGHQDPAMVTLLLRRVEGVHLDDNSQHLWRDFRSGLTQLVAAGKQDGSIRPGSAELWASVWLAVVGFAVERIVTKEWTVEHPSVTASLESAWDAIAYRGVPG